MVSKTAATETFTIYNYQVVRTVSRICHGLCLESLLLKLKPLLNDSLPSCSDWQETPRIACLMYQCQYLYKKIAVDLQI